MLLESFEPNQRASASRQKVTTLQRWAAEQEKDERMQILRLDEEDKLTWNDVRVILRGPLSII